MHRLLYSSTSDRYLHLFGNLTLALSATSINLPASLNISVQMRGHSKTIVFKFYTGPQSLLWHLSRNKKKLQVTGKQKRKKKERPWPPLNPSHSFNPTLALFRACWITERFELKNVRHRGLQEIHTNHFGREIYPRIWNTPLIWTWI